MSWIVLLIIVIILGALAGGNSLGETIREGCGCLVLLVIAAVAVLFLISKS
jgi:hypothetical protein